MAEEVSYMSKFMAEYEEIRFRNRQLHNERVEEVRHAIPEVEAIDENIRDLSIDAALAKLHEEPVDEEKLRADTNKLIERKYSLLREHGYPADYLEPIYTCSLCRDTGYADNKICNCLNQKIIAHLFSLSKLGKNLENENFDAFRSDYYSEEPDGEHKQSPRENIENIYRILKRYTASISNYMSGTTSAKGNILFQGSTGVGKTFLSNCIAKELIEQGYSLLYVSAGPLFDQLADVLMNRNQMEGSGELYQGVKNCDILIIDDLGTEYMNNFTNAHLYELLNERLLTRKPTIISTNLSLTDIKDHYSERISSRIYDSCLILKIYGEDIRLAKRRGTFSA